MSGPITRANELDALAAEGRCVCVGRHDNHARRDMFLACPLHDPHGDDDDEDANLVTVDYDR